jgi:hypothetical protein
MGPGPPQRVRLKLPPAPAPGTDMPAAQTAAACVQVGELAVSGSRNRPLSEEWKYQ